MTSFLDQLADAIQAPLRNISCLTQPSTFNVGIGIPPSYNIGLSFPADCGSPAIGPENPVLGGQCPGVLYNVIVTRVSPTGATSDIPFPNVVGPIASIGNEWVPNFFGDLGFNIRLVAPNDTEPPTPGIRRFGPSFFPDNSRQSRCYIKSIVRADGLPDNCGDSPGTPSPPFTPITINFPPTNVTIGGSTIVFSGTVTFNAPINIPIQGGLHIPVTFRVSPNIIFPGGINLPIYLRFPGFEINRNISFINFNINSITNNIDVQTSFPPTPSGGQLELPYVERIIGVDTRCSISEAAKVTRVIGDGTSTELIVPRAGVVRFYVPDFISDYISMDVDIKSPDQFVQCPNPSGAVGFEVLPNPGITILSSPRTAKLLETIKPV